MEALFLKLLRMSLSASVLVLAVLVLRLVLRRAPKWTHVLLWALVALRLLCPFTVESSLSLQPQRTDELAQSIAGYAEFNARSAVGQDGAVPEAPLDSNALHTVTVPEYDRPQSQSTVPTAWTTYFSRAWLLGVGAMLLYALVSYVRLRRRVAASLPLEGSVFVCDGIDSPFILGVFRPRVYLPSSLAEPQLSHVLSHERAHLARHDHWWKPLGFLLLSIYWFNPVLWLAYVLLCRDIELACDERVYRDMALPARADYSQTLLDCSRPRFMVAACPLAFGEAGVKDRVRAALSYKKPAFWVVVLALIACVVAAVCFLTNPEGGSPYLRVNKMELSPPYPASYDLYLDDTFRSLSLSVEVWEDGECMKTIPYSRLWDKIPQSLDIAIDVSNNLRGADVLIRTDHNSDFTTVTRLGVPDYLHPRVSAATGYGYQSAETDFSISAQDNLVLYALFLGDEYNAYDCIKLTENPDLIRDCPYAILVRGIFTSQDPDTRQSVLSRLLNRLRGAKIEFSRGDILGAEAWHALTVEAAGTRSLSGSELDELFERLQDLPRITRRGNHAGHTPMYTLRLDVTHADELVLRGYNTDGTMTEVAYRGKTWLVTDDDFSQYVRKLCEAAETAQVLRWPADFDGDGTTEYIVVDQLGCSSLATQGYAALRLEDAQGNQLLDLGGISTSHTGWRTLALCEQDGRTYLLEYSPAMFQGEANYSFDLEYLHDGVFFPAAHQQVKFSDNPGKSENNDTQAMKEFQDRANELWAHSRLLVTTDQMVLRNLHNAQGEWIVDNSKRYYIAAPDEVVRYREALVRPASTLIAKYDTDMLDLDDLNALGEKYGFEPVRVFGRSNLFHAFFYEPLTRVEANEYCEALSAEPGILRAFPITEPVTDLSELFAAPHPDYEFFLRALKSAGRIVYQQPYLSSMAYPPITDADLLAELKELLSRVEKADGDPEINATGEGFALDDYGHSYCVYDGYLVADNHDVDDPERFTVIGTAPDGLMAAVRSAARRQMARDEARSSPDNEYHGIMGLDGFFVDEELASSHYQRTYFTERNGQMVPIAESFGFTIDDHVVDLDGDGVTELVCNCVYGGDGAQRVVVYRRRGNVVERGSIDYAKVNLTAWDNWGANSTAERYNPELGVFLVKYASLASSSGDGTTSGKFLREVDYSAFAWENYAVVP